MSSKGKVLKIKLGYNPNSSSIGTHINAFLLGTAVFALAGNVLTAVVAAARAKNKVQEIQLLDKGKSPKKDEQGK